MVLILAATAAAALLVRSFLNIRRSDPQRVMTLGHDILSQAVFAGVSVLLKTLWGSAFEPARPIAIPVTSRIGEVVGEGT